jgi:hypothetical protein
MYIVLIKKLFNVCGFCFVFFVFFFFCFFFFFFYYSFYLFDINNVIIIKLRFFSLKYRCPYPILAVLFGPFGIIAPKTLYYLAFQYFDPEHTWWKLFQKRVVCTTFDVGTGIRAKFVEYNSIQYSELRYVYCVN